MKLISRLMVLLPLLCFGCQSKELVLSAKLVETKAQGPGQVAKSWLQVEAQLKEWRQRYPADPQERTLLRSAYQYIADGHWDVAEALLDQVLLSQQPEFQKEAWNGKGILAHRKQKPYEAEQAWMQALARAPDDLLVRRNLGYFYLSYAQFLKVVDLYPEDLPDYHTQLQLLIAKRNLEDSKDVDTRCEALLKKYENDKYILYNCALHEFQNNRHAERSLVLLDKAIAVLPAEDSLRVDVQRKWKEVHEWAKSHQALE